MQKPTTTEDEFKKDVADLKNSLIETGKKLEELQEISKKNLELFSKKPTPQPPKNNNP